VYQFHQDRQYYFDITNWVTNEYVIPFIDIKSYDGLKVCEIGCGEAGVLKGFIDRGAYGVGIELMSVRAEMAKSFLAQEIQNGKAEIITKNVYDIDPHKDLHLKFDLIVLKDVIEHIPDQEKFVAKLHDLLTPNGVVFFGYPPWWMPFGGHQQMCDHPVLKKLPWIHLLPSGIYNSFLKWMGETDGTIQELLDVHATGINTEKMHRIINQSGFQLLKQKYWITNPIYVKKFKIKPISSLINIPFFRNFYCTAHYVLFTRKDS
jgi:SAM-dependent methyltransferase